MKYTEIKKPIMVNIEISKDSNIKYEYDRKTNKLVVDRILRDGFYYPANYGYIPNTLDYDGDELDVLIYSPEKFLPGVSLNVKIVGAMEMIDDGETDTKLLGVHSDDYRLNDINNLDDLPKDFLEKIQKFFSTYKNWKRIGITKVKDFKDQTWAMKEYQECLKLNNDFGHLTKKEFIEEMKKTYPNKYE